MTENHRVALTEKQKEAIAEQLAEFFFGFWENRNRKTEIINNKRNSKAIVSESGLLRNFPDQTEAMT